MRILAFVAGIFCLLTVLLDAFETIILPRRAVRTLPPDAAVLYRHMASMGIRCEADRNPRKRESAFSFYGPTFAHPVLVVWAGSMAVGFALLFYALGSPVTDPHQVSRLQTDLYVSGTTIFTLGLGDVLPGNEWARALVILESEQGSVFSPW